ncbi:MAG: 5-carboxyvanillate decarboxylase [Gemmatimonadaceae bacterium]|jgi:predicted TIM-barrel fold metal-dependent hydrolase|nr:5-carboxyvanillate decarboxylase [Gemmatimonadaceae bacterium]
MKITTTPPEVIDRRNAVARISSVLAAGATWPILSAQQQVEGVDSQRQFPPPGSRVRKIATEEAFVIPEVADAMRRLVRDGGPSLDLKLMSLIYDSPPVAPANTAQSSAAPPTNRDALARTLLPRLLDIDQQRLTEMDANGVDMHLLSLVTPGVQMFERDRAVELARLANDRMSEMIGRHPTRFAGLACFAPQDPVAAAKEMERSIKILKLNGFLVNSHTGNLYLDDQRFWPILEAAEALDAPLYIHPRAPSEGMAAPFRDYRMEGAIWGYGAETGTHAVRLMLSGVLDRFPRIRIVLGHMGEALPFWLWRLDYMASPGSRAALRNKLKPSEYLQRNFALTTSGLDDPLALRFAIEKIGIDRVMWAIDYPFQNTPGSVAFIESATLSDSEREQVAHSNAERIFRISHS